MTHFMRLTSLVLTICSGMLLASATLGQANTTPAELIEALKTGKAVAIMRHAIAPGTGDPSNFDVNDCSTQRNLSEDGREQARRLGQTLRDNGLQEAAVYSSAWCRCKDTAELLGLGDHDILPALNSFFGARHRADQQMAELREWLAGWNDEKPLILVTHQVVISALTGVYPRSGETVVFERSNGNDIRVLGSF
jgi:broad specificity phosphatase PhoE